jgi:hypothetical protein
MRIIIPRISPLAVVCVTALLVVASSALANHFLGKSARTIDPRVTMEDGRAAGFQAIKESEAHRSVVVAATDGEVARTADRVGEAEALALATSLYAATQQLKGRTPRTTNDLLAGVAAESLLPPGLTLTQADGALASARGSLFVRYRVAPLGIEIVSLGREPRDGPAILVRVPDENSKEGGASLFIANRVSDVSVPAAFTPAAGVISAGWTLQPLRPLQ